MRVLLLATLLLVVGAGGSSALPDFRRSSAIGGLQLYPDSERTDLYYYAPGDLELEVAAEGEPDLALILTRYRGTAVTADQGAASHRSVLTLGVGMRDLTSELATVRTLLRERSGRGQIYLRPLPIERVETTVVFAPVVDRGLGSPASEIPGGRLEADGEGGRSTATTYWRRRRFTLTLDDGSAQALWEAFSRGRTLLSFSYAFFGRGLGPTGTDDRPEGEPVDAEAYLVANGAFAVTVDTERWPRVLQKVDLNDSAPPGYAALEVFCYDFRQALRPDLALKTVELEAEGVGGAPVRREVRFEASAPDLFAQSVRFPFAVRLDRPLRYRTLEVSTGGASHEGTWTTAESWARLLDVTSRPAAVLPEGVSDAQD